MENQLFLIGLALMIKEVRSCSDDDDEGYGLYESWSYMIEKQEYDKADELALTIRDLPLSE